MNQVYCLECNSFCCYKEDDDFKWKIFKKRLSYLTSEYQKPIPKIDEIWFFAKQ